MKAKPLLAIFLIVFVDILAFTLILPYLPILAEKFGASPTQVGMLVTAFALCQFLSSATLGRLSDIYGRKPVLVFSQIGTLIGFILLATANSLAMVFLARIVDGFTAGNLTVAQAAISDVTEPKNRTRAFALIGISFGLGFFIGPALSGLLVPYGLGAPAWGAAALSALSIVATLLILPVKEQAEKPAWRWRELLKIFDLELITSYLKRARTRPHLIQFFLFNFSFTIIVAGFALYCERRLTWSSRPFGPVEISYIYSYLGLIGIFVQGYVLGKFVDRFGDRRTTQVGLFLQGLGYCGYAFSSNIAGVLASATFGNVGTAFSRAAITSSLTHSAEKNEQGTILGVAQALAAIAGIIAPLIGGMLMEDVSLAAWALAAGGSALLGLLL